MQQAVKRHACLKNNFMLSVVQLKHTTGYLRGFDGFCMIV